MDLESKSTAAGAKVKLGIVFEETLRKEEEEKQRIFEERRRAKAQQRRKKLEAARRRAKLQNATSSPRASSGNGDGTTQPPQDLAHHVSAETGRDLGEYQTSDSGQHQPLQADPAVSSLQDMPKRKLSTAEQRRQRRRRGKSAKRQRELEAKQLLEAEQALERQRIEAEQARERQQLAKLAEAERLVEEARQRALKEELLRVNNHLAEADGHAVVYYWPCVAGRRGEVEEELAEVVAARRAAEERERRRLQAEEAERELARRLREEEEKRERERKRREEEEAAEAERERAKAEREREAAEEERRRVARVKLELLTARRTQRAASVSARPEPLSTGTKRREQRRRARERSLSIDASLDLLPATPSVTTAAPKKLPTPIPPTPTPAQTPIPAKPATAPREEETKEEREARVRAREEEKRRKKRERRNQKKVRSRAASLVERPVEVQTSSPELATATVGQADPPLAHLGPDLPHTDPEPPAVANPAEIPEVDELQLAVTNDQIALDPVDHASLEDALITEDSASARVPTSADPVGELEDDSVLAGDGALEGDGVLGGERVLEGDRVLEAEEPAPIASAAEELVVLDLTPEAHAEQSASQGEDLRTEAVLVVAPEVKPQEQPELVPDAEVPAGAGGHREEEVVRMRVLYDYTPDPDAHGELELLAGDIVLVYLQDQREGDPWWFGEAEADGSCGYFPESFVERADLVNTTSAEADDQMQSSGEGSTLLSPKSPSLSKSPRPCGASPLSPSRMPAEVPAVPKPAIPYQSVVDNEWPRGLVTYEWAARAPDEMDLHLGEVIEVYEQDPSGWWTGAFGEERYGLFPSRFISLLSKEQARKLRSVTNVKQKVMAMVVEELAEKQKDEETRLKKLKEWKRRSADTSSTTSHHSIQSSQHTSPTTGKKVSPTTNKKSSPLNKAASPNKEDTNNNGGSGTQAKKVSPTKKAGSRIIKLLGSGGGSSKTSRDPLADVSKLPMVEEPLPSPKRRSASISSPRERIDLNAMRAASGVGSAAHKTRSGSVIGFSSSASSSLIAPMMKKKAGSSIESASGGSPPSSPEQQRKKRRGSWLLGRAVDPSPEEPKASGLSRRFQRARVVRDYDGSGGGESRIGMLRKGEVVLVFVKDSASGMWTGQCEADASRCGAFPSHYVQLLD